MKEKILQLREEGKTYKQIQEILNCSKSTICVDIKLDICNTDFLFNIEPS